LRYQFPVTVIDKARWDSSNVELLNRVATWIEKDWVAEPVFIDKRFDFCHIFAGNCQDDKSFFLLWKIRALAGQAPQVPSGSKGWEIFPNL
jgi:hypothetical protein